MAKAFDTPLVLSGPLRSPRQMLADQTYDGHESLHDDAMAQDLGFKAAPIEGPTHFSQFVPLLHRLWGDAWFETGCLSAHFRNMVVEGEDVRAFVEPGAPDAKVIRIGADKAGGQEVLRGTASVGREAGTSELERRLAALRPAETLVILEHLSVGQRGPAAEAVRMDMDQRMGDLYPFSLADKLKVITETTPWYSGPSPWGGAVIPLEMVSVLAQYTSHQAGMRGKGPAIGLFADLEIRMLKGPLLVGRDYLIEREIVALSESRRTESYWVKSRIMEPASREVLAEMLLNHAVLKDSYAAYEDEYTRLRAAG
ncbi:MAG: hypothetical protein HOA08_03630 [Rhodospirillaceae bacterium]|nr:hypothetical protein [Rhodospirillaceae bacterium]MBT3492205.1 hypothetical protein [Rhodospirillaceae bacterium]MBT3778544.1 hypothetical protein [Rhodospirillaceae bacterium]MBT3977550.1 hypothetical protein [Rhodospirillaceae bacterium]MBT4168500.1 hypothetical protein [Rhodospirillaceae bacterium]